MNKIDWKKTLDKIYPKGTIIAINNRLYTLIDIDENGLFKIKSVEHISFFNPLEEDFYTFEKNKENRITYSIVEYMKKLDYSSYLNTYRNDLDAFNDIKNILSIEEGIENQVDEILMNIKKYIMKNEKLSNEEIDFLSTSLFLLTKLNTYHYEFTKEKNDSLEIE